eukprot:g8427.t1
MSEVDAFRGADATTGVTVWRIEDFKPVKQPTSKTGHFYSGDSYIVLNVISRTGVKEFHIHFWLGKDTTRDESTTAAYLAAALDELLGGTPIQYREIQGDESDVFLQLFKHGVRYEDGGVKSGLNHVTPQQRKTRLLHLRGTPGVRIAEVPVEISSLNHGDCFILDDGLELFQWNGKDASTAEKSKALTVTSSIKNEERYGKAMIIVLNDGDYESENAKHFFKLLGASNATPDSVQIASAVSKEKEKLFQSTKLFKVTDGEFTEIKSAPGGFPKSQLVDDGIFVLNLSGKAYIWIGSKTAKDVKKQAMNLGTEFIEKHKLPISTQIQIMKQGLESPVFRGCFQKWEEYSLKEKLIKAKTRKERAEVDVQSMVSGLDKVLSAQLSIDNGLGTIKTWRIENYELIEWPRSLHGQFYAGDSFIVKYTYFKSGSERCILYFWQGRDSSSDEKGASAVLAAQLDEELGGAPVQIRVVQNKEPNHFHLIFKGCMVVHLGGFNNIEEGKTGPEGEKLYHVKGYNFLDTHAVQVRTTASSLNSGDSFVLLSDDRAIVWQGELCSDDERLFATTMAERLAQGKLVVSMEEGNEDDAFWKMLGGQKDYPNVGDIGPVEQPPRLFQISDSATGGRGIAVTEIFQFHQEDLIEDDVMLLDTYKELYLWIGRNARENEKKEGVELARKYLAELHEQNGRDLETPIATVCAGMEPPTFTCHFLGWDDTRTMEFIDPYKMKLKKLESEQTQNSELAKLAGERRKKFVDPRAARNLEPVSPTTPSVEVGGSKESEVVVEFKFKPLVDFFKLEELVDMKSEGGIDVTRKEDYLTEDDFEKAFGITRDKFKEMAFWRQKAQKQQLGLF